MGYLKTMFSKDNKAKSKDTVPEQRETYSPQDQENGPVNTPENIDSTPTPVILMNRLFHNQKSPISKAPETIYENETWAPETEFVGLFRKRRVNIEEQSISSSDPL